MNQCPQPLIPPRDDPWRAMDHSARAQIALLTGGLSPASWSLALRDWWMHALVAPGTQARLALEATRLVTRSGDLVAGMADSPVVEGNRLGDSDPRLAGEDWQRWPWSLWRRNFLAFEHWCELAVSSVPGVEAHHRHLVGYLTRQICEALSPANFLLTNPELLEKTLRTGGSNLITGLQNLQQDLLLAMAPKHGGVASGDERRRFRVGRELAVTPGKVVFRNHLIELLQYSPTQAQVHAEPVLIVPAWIMKYYILDLSPANSLVRYLVDQGFTVYCISWHNVGDDDSNVGLDDYRECGVMAALEAVCALHPKARVHATGYCLGGTLLSIAAANMARVGDERLATVTLFAAQTDFSEPGDLQLFIDESQVSMLESVMHEQGTLSGGQMVAAFQLLQSRELIFNRMVHDYLLGERAPLMDLVAWNADTTRMPYRMHTEYLRRLFLRNELAAGHYEVEGRPISLRDLHLPLFLLGTERDQIAPWKSVFKLHQLCDSELTFVLTNGGHNAGVVSEPGHSRRHFRIANTPADALRSSPEAWLAATPMREGSWWEAWSAWLATHCTGALVSPPRANAKALGDAPGTYVLQT